MERKYNPCKIGFPIQRPNSRTLGNWPDESKRIKKGGLVIALAIVTALALYLAACQKYPRSQRSLDDFTLEDCPASVQRNLAFFKDGDARLLSMDEIFDVFECLDLLTPDSPIPTAHLERAH